MKFDKFTKVLINLVLILLIALLLKSLIIAPKDVYAKSNLEYKLVSWTGRSDDEKEGREHEALINQFAKQGWRLFESSGAHYIFER